jgi:glycosyltransferase involved in cell wall biosynthesis
MIARDEAARIARALDSARPYVDRMIVLDTGSLDSTASAARACGADVRSFTWCDDFSAARNAALAWSDAAWNLVLDADEWLEDGIGCLAQDELTGAGPRFLGDVRIANQMDSDGVEGTAGSWIARLLPSGVGYAGRIHEQPVRELPHVRLPLLIGHDGYTSENLDRKGARNETLLMREIEAQPTDAYLWFQLAKEHQSRGRAAQAALCFTEARRLAPHDAPWRHALIVRSLIALKADGRLQDALALADEEVLNWQDSPDFYYVVGDLYLEASSQDPDRALASWLPVVEQAWKRCLEIGERPDLDGAVTGRGGHLAAHNLAVFYKTIGRPALASQYQALTASLRA